MAATLNIEVLPKTELRDETRAREQLFLVAEYSRAGEVPRADSTDGPPPVPTAVAATVRAELDSDGHCTLALSDGVEMTTVALRIETAQGNERAKAEATFPAETKAVRYKFELGVKQYNSGGDRSTPELRSVLQRAGRFTRFDTSLPEFSRHRLFVAPIRPEKIDGRTNPQPAAARQLLGLQGKGDIDSFEVGVLDGTAAQPAAANALQLQETTLKADGTFTVSLPVVGDEVGWFWTLIGPTSYVGYQRDPSSLPAGSAVIILPPIDPHHPSGNEGSGEHAGEHSQSSPMDFDEQQLLDNPANFGDDPGSNCSPFSNPQRVLGERSFHTVLRVDQPEIGGEGSLRISRPIVLDLAPPIRTSVLTASFVEEPADRVRRVTSAIEGHIGVANLSRTARLTAAVDSTAQPIELARSVIDSAMFRPANLFWRDWIKSKTRHRAAVSPSNPIEWEGDPTIYQAGSVAGGHILEHRVQWRSNGYSLGDVAHTLTLAPRQTRRISKVSWRRKESAVRQESTAQKDNVAQTTLSERDYSDAVQSNLSEWSKGGSNSSTTGVAGGIGFALGPVVIGGGAAHGSASSSSWQDGGRRVAASEQQSLRDAIRQYGDSVRRLESTVVTEMSQEEEVEGVSETIRNVNYCHALTVVYHEILRHYRVDTSFAGVRECLFVPFSVSPFDVRKALKWRDKLRRGLLDRTLRGSVDYLDEVANAWVDSSIPPGRRSSHPVTFISGSLFIQMSVESPRAKLETETIDAYRALWSPLARLLGTSFGTLLEELHARTSGRDSWFQRQVAPTMAAKWADRLKVKIGGTEVAGVDFTMASAYRFGGTVRVDFSFPVDGSYTRGELENITFFSTDELPVGSVANLNSARFDYFTDHFQGSTQSVRTTNDLVVSDTGKPDPVGAITRFPLTDWERQDLRRVIEDGVDRLIVHLNSNLVYYHKVIWWLLDRDELFMLLDGFVAPYGRRFENGKWVEDTGRSLASVVEREPLGILGNSLVFRVSGGVFLGINGHESPKDLHSYYYDSDVRPQPLRVSLPTDGVYAQALMDNCEACEEHFGSTDWVLSDKDPELEFLADQLSSRRVEPANLTPSTMPSTLINLQNAPTAPDPVGLAGILGAVTNSGSFRDMAGLAGTQANAMGALTQAASLAQSFGSMAVDFQKSKQATTDAKQKLSNIKKAKADGLIDESEAKKQSAAALSEQNMTPEQPALTSETPISNALHRAGAGGQPIEVSRQGQYGTEMVRVGRSLSEPVSGDLVLASYSEGSNGKKSATKLPARAGSQPTQAWELLAPIAARKPGDCATGIADLGTLLFVHDAETDIDLRGYGARTNATAWMLVHTVSDLIEGLRSHVGNCGTVSGIHIEAHGGWSGSGGFRVGDDTDGDGHVESGEAQDFVSSAAHAAKFGAILKAAFTPGGSSFISIAACNSSGPSDVFIKALQVASGVTVIGSVGSCESGGSWWSGAWWEAEKGRSQVDAAGVVTTDMRDEGTGIWRPF